MRLKPLIGERLWFGPHRLGWGWTPASWEGWAVTIASLVLALSLGALLAAAAAAASTIAIIGALILVCVLKGTSPGGPSRAAEFDRRYAPSVAARTQQTDDPYLLDVLQRMKSHDEPPSA